MSHNSNSESRAEPMQEILRDEIDLGAEATEMQVALTTASPAPSEAVRSPDRKDRRNQSRTLRQTFQAQTRGRVLQLE